MSLSNQSCITKELFETALREFFKNKNIIILGYTNTAAVSAGDNYTSDLYRASITYGTGENGNKESISIIAKCFPKDKELMEQFVTDTKLFAKETEMYKKTLPALHDVLGKLWYFSAKFIYHTKDPHEVIIFEDLSASGFKMFNRQKGFDLEHCLMIVKKMAHLHASSLVLYENDPAAISKYTDSLFSKTDMIFDWMKVGYTALIEACKNWEGLEKYSNKLKAIEDKFLSRVAASSKRKLGGFHVLNHGDAWVNNFMFSYTPEGKLKDFKFVDYQMIVFTSPAVDLHYFWATSPKLDVRREHLETILDFYYTQLLATLTRLNYSLDRIPSKEKFREDWNMRSFYGLAAAITVLPLVKASCRPDATLDNLMAEKQDKDGFRHHVYNNDKYRKHMEHLLPFFDKLGALDYY